MRYLLTRLRSTDDTLFLRCRLGNEGKAWLVQIIEEAANVLMTRRSGIGFRDADKSQIAMDELPASDRFAFASRPP